MPIDPDIAAKLLDADMVNIAKRIQDGKPVTAQQRSLLEDSTQPDDEDGDQCYTINKLSILLDADRRTITKHLKNEEPDKVSGKLRLFKLSRVAEILEEASGKGSDKQKYEIKKLIAQIKNIELRNSELSRKLLPASEVASVYFAHVGKARSVLLGMEDLAPNLTGLSVNDIKTKLRQAIKEVIEALHECPLNESDTDKDTE